MLPALFEALRFLLAPPADWAGAVGREAQRLATQLWLRLLTPWRSGAAAQQYDGRRWGGWLGGCLHFYTSLYVVYVRGLQRSLGGGAGSLCYADREGREALRLLDEVLQVRRCEQLSANHSNESPMCSCRCSATPLCARTSTASRPRSLETRRTRSPPAPPRLRP